MSDGDDEIPRDIGSLTLRTERFLLSALKQKSLELYVRALQDFKAEVDQQCFGWVAASPWESWKDVFWKQSLTIDDVWCVFVMKVECWAVR